MDMKKDSALGFIETTGLAAAIAAADAALKAANVRLIGREKSKGQGCITVKIAGEVAAVQAAISAAKTAAEGISQVISTDVIPRPAGGLAEVMVWNDETICPPDESFLPAKKADSPLVPVSEPEQPALEPELSAPKDIVADETANEEPSSEKPEGGDIKKNVQRPKQSRGKKKK
jgi:microcompartment protein CcmL/EutN